MTRKEKPRRDSGGLSGSIGLDDVQIGSAGEAGSMMPSPFTVILPAAVIALDARETALRAVKIIDRRRLAIIDGMPSI
jgi:hypothetical protein